MKYTTRKKAILLLADGTIFYGKAIGKGGTAFGEVCFNTGMTGYQLRSKSERNGIRLHQNIGTYL